MARIANIRLTTNNRSEVYPSARKWLPAKVGEVDVDSVLALGLNINTRILEFIVTSTPALQSFGALQSVITVENGEEKEYKVERLTDNGRKLMITGSR